MSAILPHSGCPASLFDPSTAAAARSAAEQFLRRHHMCADQIDMEEQLQKLLKEMDQVRAGVLDRNGNRVKMIPSYIGSFHAPAHPTQVTVIDIGGTNVRSAVVTLGPGGTLRMDQRLSFLTPGVKEETDTAHFFRDIAEGVRSNLFTGHIGICFSLATIPQRDGDAVMCAGGKQIRIRDMIGKKVGQSFREALAGLGMKADHYHITVVNDTVAAALGGQGEMQHYNYSTYIGFIYGTGTNLCYREKESGEMINVESGAYCGFPTGDIDDLYDQSMIDTGADRFEKMVSGGYQGGLMECVLHTAMLEGELSQPTYERILCLNASGKDTSSGQTAFSDQTVPSGQMNCSGRKAVSHQTESSVQMNSPAGARSSRITSRDISTFSIDPFGADHGGRIASACNSSPDGEADRAFLYALFDGITARSACLCAVTLTAALMRSAAENTRDTPSLPAFITAEGSTFAKQKDFRSMLEAFMSEFAAIRHGFSYEFHTIEDAVLKGTAISCLSE